MEKFLHPHHLLVRKVQNILPSCSASASTGDRASTWDRAVLLHQSIIWLAPCHHISQSFDLPPATASPCYHVNTLPHQSVIWLAPCHHISQSFDLPSTTTSPCYRITMSLHYHVTASVSHLICPLPPHQSVIWLAHYHHISQSFDLPTATISVSHLTCCLPLHHCVTMSPCYCNASNSDKWHAHTVVSHLQKVWKKQRKV